MTREEELDWLCRLRSEIYVYMPKDWLIPMNNALDMAISALSEKKGEWIKVQSGDKDFPESIVCSKCGNENSHFDFNEHAEPIGKVFVTSKFCPNCGADMRPEPYKAESEVKPNETDN